MKRYMLMFSLGPVQIFIEQARKTRDLWLGSYLLAVLIEAAMEKIPKENLVFPTEKTIKNTASLPNKFVAIFDEREQAEAAVKQSEEDIAKRWNTIRNDVQREVIPSEYRNDGIFQSIWAQSDPGVFFEIFWVIVEGEDASTSDYGTWLMRTESALEARKRLRDFLPREEPGEKSSISGEREALHGTFDPNSQESIRTQVKQFWVKLAKKQALSSKNLDSEGAERLDAIDTIKRFAIRSPVISSRLIAQKAPEEVRKGVRQPFPSTSSVATASFVERLLSIDEGKLGDWKKLEKSLAEMWPEAIPYLEKRAGKNRWILEFDGDCYFKETFMPRYLEKNYARSGPIGQLASDGQEALRKLFAVTDELSIRRPTPYYAVMKMDGDRMGKLLGNIRKKQTHIELTGVLSKFSRDSAIKLVEEQYPGRVVYTGGDDILALAPLARDIPPEASDKGISTIINLADELQKRYTEPLQEKIQEALNNGALLEPVDVSASTSIVFAHHFTALSAVLRAVREGERLAKIPGGYGRNALVVTVMRRSGEQTRVGCHWRYPDLGEEAQPIRLFTRFYDLFDRDVLSPKCVFFLLEEAPTLVSLELAAQTSEVKRVLRRQRDERRKDLLSDEEIPRLAERLVKLANKMDEDVDGRLAGEQYFQKGVYLHEDKPRYGLVEVLGWLLVMAFLARKEQD